MFSKEVFFFSGSKEFENKSRYFFTCVLAVLHALVLLFNLRIFLSCSKICTVPSRSLSLVFLNQKIKKFSFVSPGALRFAGSCLCYGWQYSKGLFLGSFVEQGAVSSRWLLLTHNWMNQEPANGQVSSLHCSHNNFNKTCFTQITNLEQVKQTFVVCIV